MRRARAVVRGERLGHRVAELSLAVLLVIVEGVLDRGGDVVLLARIVRHEHLLEQELAGGGGASRVAVVCLHFGGDGREVGLRGGAVDRGAFGKVFVVLTRDLAVLVEALVIVDGRLEGCRDLLVRAVVVVGLNDVVVRATRRAGVLLLAVVRREVGIRVRDVGGGIAVDLPALLFRDALAPLVLVVVVCNLEERSASGDGSGEEERAEEGGEERGAGHAREGHLVRVLWGFVGGFVARCGRRAAL